MKSGRKIIETRDGSTSLFDPNTGDNYHSIHGAERESKHVFIKKGLLEFPAEQKLRILEVGLGTGLNALLTFAEASERGIALDYVGLEPYPIEANLIADLHFKALEKEYGREIFHFIHSSKWGTKHNVSKNSSFRKERVKLQDFKEEGKFDLIYYDAFGPTYQSDMWEPSMLEKLTGLCEHNALLVSYCAQGQFQRNLTELGFEVVRTDGPPGKREMVQAYFCHESKDINIFDSKR